MVCFMLDLLDSVLRTTVGYNLIVMLFVIIINTGTISREMLPPPPPPPRYGSHLGSHPPVRAALVLMMVRRGVLSARTNDYYRGDLAGGSDEDKYLVS